MNTIPTHLTDSQLIEELSRRARCEREATATLVAHLAEMDARQLHAGLGFSSLFAYCVEVLRLSEGATYKRIEVARAARRFPFVLDRLADGSLSLSTALLLVRHLTPANHAELFAAAAGLSKRAVEELVAQRFPRPDVVALVRKLPLVATSVGAPLLPASEAMVVSSTTPPSASISSPVSSAPSQPVVTPLASDRYQIRFTASATTRKKLRVAQDLLRHAVPNGDVGEIFDRALTTLIAELARKKYADVKKPVVTKRGVATRSRTSQLRCGARSGYATRVAVPSSRSPADAARSEADWSSTTSSPSGSVARRPSKTSSSAAAPTTATRRSSSLGRGGVSTRPGASRDAREPMVTPPA